MSEGKQVSECEHEIIAIEAGDRAWVECKKCGFKPEILIRQPEQTGESVIENKNTPYDGDCVSFVIYNGEERKCQWSAGHIGCHSTWMKGLKIKWLNENNSIKEPKAISAERNANLEKIRELQSDIQMLFTSKHKEIKSLESKLAEAEKRNNELQKYPFGCDNADAMTDRILMLELEKSELEAEAKAARSKTIEEMTKLVESLCYCIDVNHAELKNCPVGKAVANAIRALNSEKNLNNKQGEQSE